MLNNGNRVHKSFGSRPMETEFRIMRKDLDLNHKSELRLRWTQHSPARFIKLLFNIMVEAEDEQDE